MSGARRRWTFGSWPSIITVFTVVTVVFLAVWLINQSSAGAPRPEGNSDFPVVPDFESPTPAPRGSDTAGSLAPGSPSPSSKSPTPPPAPPEEPEPEPLRAKYSYEDGFWDRENTIVVRNENDQDLDGWTVVIEMPDGMTIDSAEGAEYKVNGRKVTFTPSGNATVPGGGSVQFTFSGAKPVDDSDGLASCKINGNRC